MKKINIADCVCTIEQGKRLDELLGRTGQYGNNLFSHCVFCPDPTGEQWHYEVIYQSEWNYYNKEEHMPGEIVCNAYCDAELDQLLPNSIEINGSVVFIGMCKTHDNKYQTYYRNPKSIMSTTPLETMGTSAQAKAQCLIWLIENTNYKPSIE